MWIPLYRVAAFLRPMILCIVVSLVVVAGCQNNRPDPSPPADIEASAPPTPTMTLTPNTSSISDIESVSPSEKDANQAPPSAASGLAGAGPIVYLGEGVQSYTIPSGFKFLVKRHGPYRVEFEPGPTYEGRRNERVWQVENSISLFRIFEEEHDFGTISGNCRINYIQIDDDIDGRRNRFYLDGSEVHTMPQGMVVFGDFMLSQAGRLTLYAEDSIAANITVNCIAPPTRTVTPTESPTSTPTSTPTTTPTIPTLTPNVPVSLTGTPTSTPVPQTPTSTATAVTVTPTPPPSTATIAPTATPTVPIGPAYTRFNFEMAGDAGRDGFCYMHRDTGERLLTWQMQDGWTDSSTHPLADAQGWIEVKIPHVSIYVVVFCNDGSGLVKMKIHNGIVHPESGEIVGWLTRGVRNAIEIGWP